jgi:hypothetical protein
MRRTSSVATPISALALATLILATLSLSFSSVAAAQHRGGGAMTGGAPVSGVPVSAGPGPGRVMAVAPHGVASAPHQVARVSAGPHMGSTGVGASAVGVHRVNVGGTLNRHISIASGLRELPLFPTEENSVPGLGFDFPHFAAVNQNRVRSRFDRAGLGFGFGGFLLEPSVIVVEQPGDGQPVIEGTAAVNPTSAENERDLSDQFLPAPAVSAPPRESAEYVFVRRDGTLLFAVAYSWDNGTLRYVTKDGVRRSVTEDALDMDATQRFNEQRGLSFRTPA